MSALVDVVASVLLLAGVALTLLAGVGMLRLPDVLSRMHAQTKPAVLGLLLILAGIGLETRSPGLAATLLLVAAFQVITAPVGAHMIGRVAYRAGHASQAELVRDDLAADDADRDGAPEPQPGTGPQRDDTTR